MDEHKEKIHQKMLEAQKIHGTGFIGAKKFNNIFQAGVLAGLETVKELKDKPAITPTVPEPGPVIPGVTDTQNSSIPDTRKEFSNIGTVTPEEPQAPALAPVWVQIDPEADLWIQAYKKGGV